MLETTGRRIRCMDCGASGFEPILHYDSCKPKPDAMAAKVQRFVDLSRELEEAIECVFAGSEGMHVRLEQKAIISAYAAPLANVLASNELALPGVIEMLRAATAERKQAKGQ